MNQNQQKALTKLKTKPVEVGHKLGFDKLGSIHNEWILSMLYGKEDETLQAHRGSYKTTCVSISLLLLVILRPNERIVFIRKTDADVKEIIEQVYKMLCSEFIQELVRIIWNVDLVITKHNATEVNTNLTNDPRGISQLVGMGIGGSMTGKHFDRIFTDDIVNLQDRVSRAERERTKLIYQELENIKNREHGCRTYNTGTPWHKEDAFTLMPNIKRYDCDSTGLMTAEEIQYIKDRIELSLFYANYKLKHIADESQIFSEKPNRVPQSFIMGGIAHVDAAYEGEDFTAFSIMVKDGDKYYLYGRIWRKHVQDCYDEIKAEYDKFQCRALHNETNGDKGYAAKDMRAKGMHVITYVESTNKFFKISAYLKGIWADTEIVEGTDEKYLEQIVDFTEEANHDDAPDSASCLARLLYKPKKQHNSNDRLSSYLL